MKLSFGKYKGERLYDVPPTYLFWLTCWELDEDRVVAVWSHYDGYNYKEKISDYLEDCPSARRYLIENHLHVVWEARKVFERKRICAHCFGKLVPVGTARRNGKAHRDWSSRKLHKSCWTELDY